MTAATLPRRERKPATHVTCASARTAFRMLRAARRLRGTPLDPFGYQSSRREERALVAWYLDIVERATARLGECPLPIVTELLELPAAVRGYEDVKSRNAARARRRATALLARLEPSGEQPSLVVHTIEDDGRGHQREQPLLIRRPAAGVAGARRETSVPGRDPRPRNVSASVD